VDPPTVPAARSEWRTVPNLLSFGRLAATPFLGWLIASGHTSWATALFGVMGVSDYLDGYIARRTNTVSDLGVLLDPTSDRIVAMVAGVTLMAAHRLPLWMGIPVLLRDVVLSLAFLYVARRGFGRPKVRQIGKTATFALFLALPALTLGGVLRPFGLVMFAVGGVLYFVAGYRYAKDVRTYLAGQRAPFTS
jgi:cardiolipin synthase